MAQETLSVFQKALNEFASPRLQKAIVDKSTVFMGAFEDKTAEMLRFGGRDATLVAPVHKKRNWGTGANIEGGGTGTPRNHGFAQYQSAITGLDVNLEISDRLIKATETRPDLSYVGSALEFEMQQVMDVAQTLIAISVLGNGDGVMAQVNTDTATGGAAITATTFAVDNPGVCWLEIGMFITAHAAKTGSATNTLGDPEEITDIDPETNIVTISSTTGLADDHFIFLHGHYAGTPVRGLGAHIDDGTVEATYQNVTRSGNRFSQSHVLDWDDDLLNEEAVIAMLRRLHERAPAEQCADLIHLTNADYETLALSVLDRQRFQGTTLKGGFSGFTMDTPYGKKTFLPDTKAYPGKVRFIRSKDFAFGWMGKKGGEWFRPAGQPLRPKNDTSSGTGHALAYVATWVMYLQLVGFAPCNQGCLENYTA